MLADRLLQSELNGQGFEKHDVIRALKSSFVKTYLLERKEPNQSSAAKLINRAKRLAIEEFVHVTHHIPCQLFRETDPSEFNLGPIRFCTMETFLSSMMPRLDDYRRESREAFAAGLRIRERSKAEKDVIRESEDFAQLHSKTIHEYYSRNAWVASLTISPCHFSVSQRRAERAVDAALNVLRLFALYAPERLRRAKSAGSPSETHELHADVNDGKIDVAAVYDVTSAIAGEGWYTHHSEKARHLWEPLEDVVKAVAGAEKIDELNLRLIDALDWFGQAVCETQPAAKVVKYAAALERLTMTGHVAAGIENLVIRRVLLLNGDRKDKSASEIEQELRIFYECRSNLMHGSISTTDPSVATVLRIGWETTRWSILKAAQLFWVIRANGPPTRKSLTAAYDGGRRDVPTEPNGDKADYA
jgi:hypothetical protein